MIGDEVRSKDIETEAVNKNETMNKTLAIFKIFLSIFN